MSTESTTVDANGTVSRRAAITWVAATGATLLFAATAVFTAVHWSALHDREKFAVLVGVTLVALLGGLRIQRRLPATGAAVVHLGVLLAPIDAWALGRAAAYDWPTLLVVVGATGLLLAAPLARHLHSTVLAGAAVISGGVLAAGTGATSGIAAPLIAATAAVVLVRTRAARVAVLYAIVAGLAPVWVVVLRALQRPPVIGVGVARQLGIADQPWTVSAAVAAVAALALVVAARRLHRVDLVWAALVVVAVQAVSAASAAATPAPIRMLVAPALFLLLELAALLASRDELLAAPAHEAAKLGEALAALPLALLSASVLATQLNAAARDAARVGPGIGRALALTAAAWLVAGARRTPRPRAWITGDGVAWTHALLVLNGVGALAAAGASAGVLTGTLLAVAVGGTLLGHRAGAWLGVLALAAAALAPTTATGVAYGLVATTMGAAMALGRRRWNGDAASVVTIAAWAITVAQLHRGVTVAPALLVFEIGVALLVVAGRRTSAPCVEVWSAIAVAAPLCLVWRHDAPTLAVIGVALVVALAPRDRSARVLAVLPYTQLVVTAFVAAPTTWSTRALGVAMFAACLGALAARPERVQPEAAIGAAIAAGVATSMAALAAPRALGPVWIVLGVALAATAGRRRTFVVAHAGIVLAIAGTLVTLATHDVRTLEWYVLPVGAELLALGVAARRRDATLSSWLAYAPGLALLVVPATYVGMRHDAPGHLLFAGAVGVVAVGIGAARRLAAPLLIGTATLVAVSLPSTLGYARSVPAWMWLAVGGVALLAVAVAMERSEQRPAVVGRRVLDVVVRDFG